jgi:alkylhydroperoxidase AhpD family core domain
MTAYYDRSNLEHIPKPMKLAPSAAAAYLQFEQTVYGGSGHIPVKTKELIALAVAHVTGCPYCIDVHTVKFKAHGGTAEEMMEAVLVAASTRAGAILSHATHAFNSFKEQAEPPANGTAPATKPNAPDCFC